MSLIALVPAYNEEESIAHTLESLSQQTLKPDLIIVIPNNCTDRTAETARAYPVVVLEMPDNPDRKSGAMNWAFSQMVGSRANYIFTMDADTVLGPHTLEHLVDELEDDPELGAVTARYWAKSNKGLARRLQRLEYARFDDARELRGWKCQVASGAAVMYRNEALQMVCGMRGASGPWDNDSLIEDYALTLDLKTLGWKVKASKNAHVYTDTPVSFRELWRQRLRWGRGGVDEVRKRGWTKATRRDISSYGMFMVSSAMRVLFLSYIAMLFLYDVPYRFSWLGLIPLVMMYLDRVTSVSRLEAKSWKDRLLVHTVLVEDFYGLFLEACTVMSIYKSYRTKHQNW